MKACLTNFLLQTATSLPVALYRPQGGMAVSEYNAQEQAI